MFSRNSFTLTFGLIFSLATTGIAADVKLDLVVKSVKCVERADRTPGDSTDEVYSAVTVGTKIFREGDYDITKDETVSKGTVIVASAISDAPDGGEWIVKYHLRENDGQRIVIRAEGDAIVATFPDGDENIGDVDVRVSNVGGTFKSWSDKEHCLHATNEGNNKFTLTGAGAKYEVVLEPTLTINGEKKVLTIGTKKE